MKGIVYKSTGSWYQVKALDGLDYNCKLKGKIRLQGLKSTNPVAVGDKVNFEVTKDGDEAIGIITDFEDRKNYIIRKSVNLSKQTHIIAANVDLAFLVITLNNPETTTIFIDRFLVSSEAYDVTTILLFNKLDTLDTNEFGEFKYLAEIYRDIGYHCIGVSATSGKNLDQVKDLMIDKVSVFAGHSGVGKSSIINAMDDNINIKTKAISEQHAQGQHTTTFAEMHDTHFGAKIIDTPGIRGFGMINMEKEELGDYFREFFALKSECKFHNCLHVNEPKCAIKAALQEDIIAYSRYKSYCQILNELEEQDQTFRKNPYA
ncbi:ribosome small subunit-dependent GTPase A [Mesohalobacter halotolerans]|uniref:Small ribosomal subunit biogenesis GTPase RsgA n=1 Tax=Mesohalobacter halotolerans TaxID=1883405 RepID=A0A4U5TQM9_9FLAO|nr:ribosome small subunit-dependent GTPase A [Mesohalobacter halotolerans]MBS3738964.1 ribosome small subunit-dependent GTPase A [Psychroflexus sp.]TKS56353.1 ribosome small subunit-dependent GTPase A [Mesohalobacter halotolerans]